MAQANEVAIPPSVQGVHARLQLIEANQQLRLQVEASFIVTVHALLVALVDTIIPSRYSGRGGRYKSADTARKTYVRAIALAALRYGKFPSADDWRLLFMYPPPQKNSSDGRALPVRCCPLGQKRYILIHAPQFQTQQGPHRRPCSIMHRGSLRIIAPLR